MTPVCGAIHPTKPEVHCVFGYGHAVNYHFGGSNDSNGNMGFRWPTNTTTDVDAAMAERVRLSTPLSADHSLSERLIHAFNDWWAVMTDYPAFDHATSTENDMCQAAFLAGAQCVIAAAVKANNVT